MTKTSRADGPFDTLEATFRLGCAGPGPWSIDARQVPGLPDRHIPLDELRAILLHPSTPYRTRGRALAILVERARAQGGAATIGLAGVLLFGLRRAVAPLCDIRPDRAADIEAEALAGLVEAIAATDAGRARLAARLCWMARSRAKRLFETELGELARPGPYPDAEAPPFPAAHPDLVLAQAVTQGVIVSADAALIGDTRFGLLDLQQAGAALGISYPAARKRRTRAEKALAQWLASTATTATLSQNRPETPIWGVQVALGAAGTQTGGRRRANDRRTLTRR